MGPVYVLLRKRTNMKVKNRLARPELAKGQKWKLGEAHIEIVEVGKRLTHYKHYPSDDAKRVPVQLRGIQVLQDYLKANKAVLMKNKPAAKNGKLVSK